MEKKKAGTAVALAGAAAAAAARIYFTKKRFGGVEVDGNGKTALITGASGGIGFEFAKVYAAHGFDVVITARSGAKLEKAKEELDQDYGVKVTVIAADLSEPGGARRLYDEIAGMGIEIEQLVNNAGAGKAGDTVDMDEKMMADLIQLNVTSVTMLCRLFGADMKKRGHGRILNVSSLGAFIPDPSFNVYGPSKAYEMFLTEAMSGELKGSGVTVSAVCPGPTKTGWAKNAGKVDSTIALGPEEVAKAGFDGMQHGELVIIPGLTFKAEKAAVSLLPPKIKVALIRKWQSILIAKVV